MNYKSMFIILKTDYFQSGGFIQKWLAISTVYGKDLKKYIQNLI